MTTLLQVEKCKLRDYEGDYERFLEKNETEAEVIAEKEAKKKEIEKSQIKAKSKVLECVCPYLHLDLLLQHLYFSVAAS